MREPWVCASCHIMAHTADLLVYLVCRSFSHTQKLLCMPDENKSLRQWPHRGIRCRWEGQNSSRKGRRGRCRGSYVLQCLPCAPRGRRLLIKNLFPELDWNVQKLFWGIFLYLGITKLFLTLKDLIGPEKCMTDKKSQWEINFSWSTAPYLSKI